jgi:hypothetical protein
MCLRISNKKKYGNFFLHFAATEERSRIRVGVGSLVRGTDPPIQIRTKMSRIPNTAF